MAYTSDSYQWSSATFFPVSYHHSPDDSEMSGGGSLYENNTAEGFGFPHNSTALFGITDTPYVPPTHMQTRVDHNELILPSEHAYSSNYSGSAENLHQQQQYYTSNYQSTTSYNIDPTQSQQQWSTMEQHVQPSLQQYPHQQQQRYQMPYGASPSGHQTTPPLNLSHSQHSSPFSLSPASSHSSSYDTSRHSPNLHQHSMQSYSPYPQPQHRSQSYSAPLTPSSRPSPSNSENLDLPAHDDMQIEDWLRREANIPRGIPVGLNGLPGNFDNPDEKPPLAHRILMGLAIFESPDKQLTLSQIYEAIERRFAYYADPRQGKKWQRSMRHSLSLYTMFENRQRPLHGTGKGGYWRLVLPDPNKPYKRERKRRTQGSSYDEGDTSEEYEESDDAASHSDSMAAQGSSRPGYSSRAVTFGQSSIPGPSGHMTRPSRSGSAPTIPTFGSGAYHGPPQMGQHSQHPHQHHQIDAPERRTTRRSQRPQTQDPNANLYRF